MLVEPDARRAVDTRGGDPDRRPVLRPAGVLEVDAVARPPARGSRSAPPAARGRSRTARGRTPSPRSSARRPGPRATSSASSVEHQRAQVGGRVGSGRPSRRSCRGGGPEGRRSPPAARASDRAPLRQHRVAGEVGVPRERADRDPVAVLAHVAEVVEPADVDEQRRPGEPQPQEPGSASARRRGAWRPRPPSSSIACSTESARAYSNAAGIMRGPSPPPGPPGRCCGTRCSGRGSPRARAGSPPRTDSGSPPGARRRHHEARRAVAALERVLLVERLLHRMQLVALRETLDRRHLAAVRLHGEHGARLDRLAVEEHGAGAARGGVAADVRPLQAELLAQEVGEQLPRLDVGLVARRR